MPYYTTNCPGGDHSKLASPLKSNGELCVGYGSGGAPPYIYHIRKGQYLDVGFLKIYLSTQPIDLSGIQQKPAFLETHTVTPWHWEPQDAWDTILIPIILRRNQSSLPTPEVLDALLTPEVLDGLGGDAIPVVMPMFDFEPPFEAEPTEPSVYELRHSTHSGTAPRSDNVSLMSHQIAYQRLPVSWN